MTDHYDQAEARLAHVEEQIRQSPIPSPEHGAEWAVAEAMVAVGHALLAMLAAVEEDTPILDET